MSKLLGIDYGEKRLGIALSDESGSIAFPKGTLVNHAKVVEALVELIKKEGVQRIVMGESKKTSGEDNHIMEAARHLSARLETATGIPVAFEQEYYTSVQARRDTGKSFVDAEAAAILLNSYIVRTTNKPHHD